ncbi:Response regulator UvrY [Lacunisphaera limnophila]|uniref:Response regulator UvrY n=1 Tax=Lacunisphaera limnophila TaxID=1838286 RepID=A0A1D8ASA5_9BACT|nr:response regulator transcription factor [Lacunisphaera limnophila]AOS43774.1 Response regulator UvrY [Lacunisphaera limnophila]
MTKHVKASDTTPVREGRAGGFIGRAVIVEDQRMFAEFLQFHCRDLRLDVLPPVAGYQAGLEVIRRHKPDLVLLDLSLPDGDGLDLARLVIDEQPRVKVLAISSHHDPWTMLQVQRIGIHGFVDKSDQRPDVVSDAVHAVLAGRVYYTQIVNQSSAAIRRDPKSFIRVLSDYETRILAMIGESKTDEEIAAALNISPATGQSRRRDIMRKLDIHSTPKLIHYAIVNGLTRAEQLGRRKPDEGAAR